MSKPNQLSRTVAKFAGLPGFLRPWLTSFVLGNVVPLWETMLACLKLGAVVIPATTLLVEEDLRDRFDRALIIAEGLYTGRHLGTRRKTR